MKLLKGIFLFCAIHAQSHGVMQSGPYAGINLAFSHFAINQKYRSSDTAMGLLADFSPNVSQNVLGLGVFGGYIINSSSFWIAGELAYLWDQFRSEQKMNFSLADGVFRSQSTGAWQGLCHAGYMPHQLWAVYIILGIEFRRFQMQFYDQKSNLAARIDKKYGSFAFVPGIGIRLSLTKSFALRGEYKISLHPSKRVTNSVFNVIAVEMDTSILRQFSQIHTLQIGFVHSF